MTNTQTQWQDTAPAIALFETAYAGYLASSPAHWEFPYSIEADLAELCDPDGDLDVIGAWDAYAAMREANPLAVAA